MRAGNIPAHAGKTLRVSAQYWAQVEHPRARGENGTRRSLLLGFYGTSPRTRGKREREREVIDAERNIPAHAGKTVYIGTAYDSTSEHPRARGENDQRNV